MLRGKHLSTDCGRFINSVFYFLLLTVCSVSWTGSRAQQMKLGSNVTRFDSSAVLEIESQKFVLLLPRINDTGKIVSSVRDGSLIYFNNSAANGLNKGLYMRVGGQWKKGATNTAGAWNLNGSAGTNPFSNFIGTTDSKSFTIKTNNLPRISMHGSSGNVGFGTINPVATLHNNGSTLFGVKDIGDLPNGGDIGNAAVTVDIFTSFAIAQTTPEQVVSLPAPTDITAGRLAIVLNKGTTAFYTGFTRVDVNRSVTLIWTGWYWMEVGDNIGSAFTVPYKYFGTDRLFLMQGAGQAFTSASSAAKLIAIGLNALGSATGGNGMIAIGTGAAQFSKLASQSIAIGYRTISGATDGIIPVENIAIGNEALANYGGPSSKSGNIAIGHFALRGLKGSATVANENNIAFGTFALSTSENSRSNVAIGYKAMSYPADANLLNTAIGAEAASYMRGTGNTCAGAFALRYTSSTSTRLVTAIGFAAAANADGIFNATAIGAYCQLTNSNTIILGAPSGDPYTCNVGVGAMSPPVKLFIRGSFGGSGNASYLSDGRLKENILPIQDGLAKVGNLRGVTFKWKQNEQRLIDNRKHYGYIAQEVERVLPEVVHTAKDSMHTKSVAYAEVVPVLTQALKERQALIEGLQEEHDVLLQQLLLLEAQKERVKKLLQQKKSK